MAPPEGVLVVADGSRSRLTAASRELLALGRSLAAGLGGAVGLLTLGAEASVMADEAGPAGADRIYQVPGAERPGYHPEHFARIAAHVCGCTNPRVLLLPHSSLGVDLAPRLAFRLGAPWASGCVGAEVRGAGMTCTRNLAGGKIAVQERLPEALSILTVRARSVDALAPMPERAVVSERLGPAPEPADHTERITLVERTVRESGVTDELERAEVIVSGGLGIGSADGFASLQALAVALGGSLGASKKAVDREWVPAERQVGMTGTTVAPRLYLAIGISGATQHLMGCMKSKVIAAINKDPEAPIFRYAHIGVVGEWEEILAALLGRLQSSGRI